MTVSVVVMLKHRTNTIQNILSAWKAQARETILVDCSSGPGIVPPPDIKWAVFRPDLGCRARHAVALMTSGDLVIKADDDVLPAAGLVEDFVAWQNKLGPAILGLIGRRFIGPTYYGETKFFKSSGLVAPMAVDFVGVVTASPRAWLAFDLKECATEIEDLYWQMAAFRGAKKYVIPTKNYSNLPSSGPGFPRLTRNPAAMAIREKFYREYFLRYYANWHDRFEE